MFSRRGTATLTYDYRAGNAWGTNDFLDVEYSTDGGTIWIPLVTYNNSSDPTTFTPQSFTLNSTAANTRIRFVGTLSVEQFYVDNITISGSVAGPVKTTTDSNGLYTFDGSDCVVPSTAYQLVIDLGQAPLLGLDLTTANAVADNVDSDATQVGSTALITGVNSPATGADTSFDFGFTTVAIGDYVWRDADGDGEQDSGETGISGVQVRLLDSGGNQVTCNATAGNYGDDFESASLSGQTPSATLNWTGAWIPTGTVDTFVIDGDPAMRLNAVESVYREFDMSVFPSGTATLTYDYRAGNAWGTNDFLDVELFYRWWHDLDTVGDLQQFF